MSSFWISLKLRGCGDNWSYKTCKLHSQITTITKLTHNFRQARCPSCPQPCQSTECMLVELSISYKQKLPVVAGFTTAFVGLFGFSGVTRTGDASEYDDRLGLVSGLGMSLWTTTATSGWLLSSDTAFSWVTPNTLSPFICPQHTGKFFINLNNRTSFTMKFLKGVKNC